MAVKTIIVCQIVISQHPFFEAAKIPFSYREFMPYLVSRLNQAVRQVTIDAVGRYEQAEWFEADPLTSCQGSNCNRN